MSGIPVAQNQIYFTDDMSGENPIEDQNETATPRVGNRSQVRIIPSTETESDRIPPMSISPQNGRIFTDSVLPPILKAILALIVLIITVPRKVLKNNNDKM